MTGTVTKILQCRLCASERLRPYIDFGAVPLGNNLQPTRELARKADSYPLDVFRCEACGHFQLGHSVDPRVLYATNYTYLSGVGSSFVKHFAEYAAWAKSTCDLKPGALVVDVGSNDGTCLKMFKSLGCKVCGVDPAQLAANIANSNGIETINAFFDSSAVAEIKQRHGPADFITSHNVLAHVEDLARVFRDVKSLLKDGGHFCFEVGYFREVLEKGHFDTIYHEHLDYHHAAPLVGHLSKLGFDVLQLSVNAVQGGSLRLLLRNTGQGKISPEAEAFLQGERVSAVNDTAFLAAWPGQIRQNMSNLRDLVRENVRKSGKIVGYGAPTKATLLMKVAGLGEEDIQFVVEDNPHKVGLFLPANGISIRPTAELGRVEGNAVLLFAWNFADDIVAKLSRDLGRRRLQVIVPLPVLRSVTLNDPT